MPLPIAFPHPHVMAMAPLDAWARMLLNPPARVPPRYWLRLGFGLFTSSIGTALTLPERLALAPILRHQFRRTAGQLDHPAGALLVLGYFRSGTTHLQYLLNCDPNLAAPTWTQALIPQGYAVSWAFYRWFLVPFLTNTRPQDDVSFGPEWPAEDDFALCHWGAASSQIGKLALPQRWDHYARFHDLEGLSKSEFERWRFLQWAFLAKVASRIGDRRLLLKSPSHTARLEAMLDLLGPDRTRVIHIRRDPGAVIRSNLAMLRRLGIYHLQPALDDDELGRRVEEEYFESERRYLAARDRLPAARRVEVRFDDLRADPIGLLRESYDRLELEWTPAFERNLVRYLDSVREYRSNRHETVSAAREEAIHARFAPLVAEFEAHGSPTRAVRELPPLEESARRPRYVRALVATVAMTLIFAVAWASYTALVRNRHDALVWPLGLVAGMVALRAARRGSPALGALAAGVTIGVFIPLAFLNSWTAFYKMKPDVLPEHLYETTMQELTAGITIFWVFMGAVTAYRIASRTRAYPPRSGSSRYDHAARPPSPVVADPVSTD
ncbi:MAG: sulfotransferase family protein [Phycisphaerales bacterium]